MMDIIMVGVLVLCFVLVKLFIDWCDSQVKTGKK